MAAASRRFLGRARACHRHLASLTPRRPPMFQIRISDIVLCRIAALTSMALGTLGMFASLLFLDSPRGPDIAAGVAGIVAAAVLAAGGLVALALILSKAPAPAA